MANEVGILAYGSLIGDPGAEIVPVIVKRIACRTPFKVEFARSSESRKGGPTLVPNEDGEEVAAQILVVDLPVAEATHHLYRREIHKVGDTILYDSKGKDTPNRVAIKTIRQFENVETVLYTSIRANIREVNAATLAKLAIESARALNDGSDGISYLMNAKAAGTRTALSEAYEAEILRLTGTANLSDALRRLRT
jgi:hypothetical protein